MKRIAIARLSGLLLLPLWLSGCSEAARTDEATSNRDTAATVPADETAVRVMTFNIRFGTADDGEDAWPLRRDRVFDVIREFGPGVLGVQEALRFQLDELGTALPGYREVGVGRDDGETEGEYAAILFDSARFELEREGTFWLSDRPEEIGSMTWGNRIPRICTWARLRDRRDGRSFFIFNVHWDHQSQESRERSAALLLERIAALLRERIAARPETAAPVIVTGDFNAGEGNPAFRMLVGDPATPLRDSFRALHPDATGVGTFNGFRGDDGGEKIDAVLVSAAWEVLGAEIVRANDGGRYPSDHFPVTATLSLVAGEKGAVAGPR